MMPMLMNLQTETIQEELVLQASELMCLFELKGYECEMIKNINHTVYIFKTNNNPHIDYTNSYHPNWTVIRNKNPHVDWL
jgi:hypothetical protein